MHISETRKDLELGILAVVLLGTQGWASCIQHTALVGVARDHFPLRDTTAVSREWVVE